MMRRFALFALIVLAGCATVDEELTIPSGLTESEVVMHLGAPTYAMAMANGQHMIVFERSKIGSDTMTNFFRGFTYESTDTEAHKVVVSFVIGSDGKVLRGHRTRS